MDAANEAPLNAEEAAAANEDLENAILRCVAIREIMQRYFDAIYLETHNNIVVGVESLLTLLPFQLEHNQVFLNYVLEVIEEHKQEFEYALADFALCIELAEEILTLISGEQPDQLLVQQLQQRCQLQMAALYDDINNLYQKMHEITRKYEANVLPNFRFNAAELPVSLFTPSVWFEPTSQQMRMLLDNFHVCLSSDQVDFHTTMSTYQPRHNARLRRPMRASGRQMSISFEAEHCTICNADFQVNCQIRRLKCRHIFHARCIERQLMHENRHCPVCNTSAAIDEYAPREE